MTSSRPAGSERRKSENPAEDDKARGKIGYGLVTYSCVAKTTCTLSCPLMTELLLLQLRCAPYRGAGRAGAPNAVAAAAGSAGVGGAAAAAAAAVGVGPSSPPLWLTIVPQVSLFGGLPTAAAAAATTTPFWSSSIVVCCCYFGRPGRASPRSLGTVVDRRNRLETNERLMRERFTFESAHENERCRYRSGGVVDEAVNARPQAKAVKLRLPVGGAGRFAFGRQPWRW